MAFNVNTLKKWVGLGLPPTIVGLSVLISVLFVHDIWIAIGVFVLTTIIGILMGNLIMRNPFSQMLEGQGILTFDLSSTGIIDVFISKVNKPWIQNESRNMDDIFDRSTVATLNVPVSAGEFSQEEDGGLTLRLTKEEYNRSKFGMMQYPVLIYNSLLKSLLTKDYLSDQEKVSFSEHSIIYQNQKIHELTNVVRDFGRYVVELTKPQQKVDLLHNKWTWIVIAVGVVAMLAIFAPSIFTTIKGGISTASESMSNVAPSTQVITPR